MAVILFHQHSMTDLLKLTMAVNLFNEYSMTKHYIINFVMLLCFINNIFCVFGINSFISQHNKVRDTSSIFMICVSSKCCCFLTLWQSSVTIILYLYSAGIFSDIFVLVHTYNWFLILNLTCSDVEAEKSVISLLFSVFAL